jgi:Peptidase family M28
MKKFTFLLLLPFVHSAIAQDTSSLFRVEEISRIEKALASDDMKGRGAYTPEIDKAADFIIGEFKAAGLKPFPDMDGFRQTFSQVGTRLISAHGMIDGEPFDEHSIVSFTNYPDVTLTQDSHFNKVYIKNGDNFRQKYNQYRQAEGNFLVVVDTSFSNIFKRLTQNTTQQYKPGSSTVFILSDSDPKEYTINIKKEIREKSLCNIVGVLPGRSAGSQFVIFSAHYDHLGIGKPDSRGDSIYNGANDDASGVTAVITLAKYFATLNNNERSLIFVAFSGEELGILGSTYFSSRFDPATVSAMFNIEMIGTESKWGKNSAYITGFEKTDMGQILQKNLAGSGFQFYPDPYPDQNLFFRSDNASLAKMGVPAHTISTSKMDSEKYYHTAGDEVETLDLPNMTEIIRSIGLSAGTIVSGKDTPSRVK